MRLLCRCFVALCGAFVVSATFSQESKSSINSSTIIDEGISLHNKGKYKEAIAVYKKVSRSDTNYNLILQNLSVSEYGDSNYAASKKYAEEGLKLYPEKANEWYNLIANNLDEMGQPQEALATYDKVINSYQNQYVSLVNKGITYYRLKQLSEAKKCFQQAMMINPYYASAHYQLGNVAYDEGNIVGAMLCFVTNLLVNPENNLSGRSIKMLSTIAKVSDEVVKKASGYKASSLDNFEMVQEIVVSKLALEKQYKSLASLEDPIVRQLQVVFEKLDFNPADKGFYTQYYLPIYQQLFKGGHFEPLVYYLFRSLDVKDIQAYIKKNNKKIDALIPQATEYFNSVRKSQVIHAADRPNAPITYVYSNNNLVGKGKVVGSGDNEKLVGPWEFYHDNGALRSKGLLIDSQEKTGEWMFYYSNGILKEKSIFKDGKADGKCLMWFDNGKPYTESMYKAGELNGAYTSYYYNGLLHKMENYLDGKKNGAAKGYTSFGTLDYTCDYKDDKEEGVFTYYHKNGKVSSVANYKNGDAVNAYKSYYVDGTLKMEGSLDAGKRMGVWKEYFNNGQLYVLSNYNVGDLEGEYKEYSESGVVTARGLYVKGKVEGKYEDFDTDGKLYCESFYEKGKLKELKFYSKEGKIISNTTTRNGSGNLIYFDASGNKTSEGNFTKEGLRNGKATFYYADGKVKVLANYKDGTLEGERISYYRNGKISEKSTYKNDEQNGYGITYYEDGTIKHEGNVIKGSYEGLQIEYNRLGNVTSKTNYQNGEVEGYIEYYHPGGKLDIEQHYIAGWPISLKQFDTTGNVMADLTFADGNANFSLKSYAGKPFVQGVYNSYYMHGEHKSIYPNGTPVSLDYYKYGVRDSITKKYSVDGKLEYEGSYYMGEKHGKWNYYNEEGKLEYSKTYNNGRLNGSFAMYNNDGDLDKELVYNDNRFDGPYKMYGEKGKLALVLNYKLGDLDSYSYEDKTGKLVAPVPVKDGTADVVAYYSNGTKSAEITFRDGEENGIRNLYFSNGKPYLTSNCVLGYDHGLKKVFYANGQLKREENYHYDELHGAVKTYWENGKIRKEENWYNGERHGITKHYDSNGNLQQTLTYYYGTLQLTK